MNVHIGDASPDQEDVRDGLERELTRRWTLTAREVRRSILAHDALGIGEKAPQNAMPIGDKAEMFRRWLNERLSVGVGGWDGSWLETFVNRASTRGTALGDAQAGIAFLLPSGPAPSSKTCHKAAVGALAGICQDVSDQAHEAVAHGLLARIHPRKIARMVDHAMGQGLKRSRQLAEHSVTQAFTQATLDALEASGVTHVGTVSERKRRIRDAFDPDEPRDPHGMWTAGEEIGDLRSVKTARERGGWAFKAGEVRPAGGFRGYDQTTYRVAPTDIPADWKAVEKSHRTEFYDPEHVHEEDGQTIPNEDQMATSSWSAALPEKQEPGIIYRGMSWEEYQGALKSGEFRSRGDWNIGDVQKGLTMWSSDPMQARSYASDFAPWQFKATPSRPAVIVALKDPGEEHHVYTVPHEKREIGLKGAQSVSDISHVFMGRPTIMSTGELDVRKHESGDLEEGGGVSPSSYVRWERQKAPALHDAEPIITMARYGTRYEEYDAPRKTPQPKHPRSGKFAKAHVVAREMRRSKRTGRFRKQGLEAEAQRKEELAEARFGRIEGRFDILTAGDDRVCDVCDGISENGPYSINEARGLIPAHPNCRCVFVAAGSMQDAYDPDQPRDESGKWVSDESGKPLVMYHGAGAPGRHGDMLGSGGVYLTNSREYAKLFGDKITAYHVQADKILEEFEGYKLGLGGEHLSRYAIKHGYHAIRGQLGQGNFQLHIFDPAKRLHPVSMADFDPDEPRDERGRWSTSGGKAKELEGGGRPDPGDRPPEFSRVPNEEVAASLVWGEKVKERVLAQAAADGYPARHIEVLSYPNSNLLAGANYNTLAWYDPNTGKIQVFADAMQGAEKSGALGNTVEGTAAHEIMHAKTDWWLKMNPSIETKLKDEIGFGSNSLDRPLGKGFATPRKLMGDDGVTPYSTRTWEQWLNSQDPSKSRSRRLPFDLPFGETISEMRAVQRETGRLPGTDSWKAIYQDIEDEWEHGQSTDLVGIELNPRVRPDPTPAEIRKPPDDPDDFDPDDFEGPVTVTRVKH